MSSPPETAPDLVRGLRAGRRDAFERLYGEYHAPIYNLCARVLGDREEAKDVTQEVFIKAFDQLPQTDAESFGLRPWLYRVATNACFNTLRSRRKLDDGGDAGIEQAASGVDEFERAQTVALVEQSLGEMNERYRTALVLKDLQGLPPEEIAEVMEVSRANADVIVHRARASFKTAFAKLAGDKIPAPAALGLALLPLSVPAALQAMPSLPHLAPAAHVPGAPPTAHPGVHLPDLSSAAGPGGAGLLAKIGAALTTKVGITAAAATLAVGGAVAVRDVHSHDAQHEHAGPHESSLSTAWAPASAMWSKQQARWTIFASWQKAGWPAGCTSGHMQWDSHSCAWSWQEGSHHSGAHDASGHASSGSHDSTTHTGDDGTGSPSSSHDSLSGSSSGHDSGGSTSASHDSGETSDTHDSGSGSGW